MKNLAKKLEDLKSKDVYVGIPTDLNKPVEKSNVATIAATLEYGSATQGIPPRPFLRKTLADNQQKYVDFYHDTLSNDEDALVALKKVAKMAQADVQENIRNGPWAANSQATIEKKGSSRPLIDTGRMRQSIRGIVKNKGENG